MKMNLKLRLMLLNSSRQAGFALPMTLIIGLVMLLIGVAMIVRSQSDQSKAMAQKDTAVGLSVAEVGIARYQDLMQKNKYIAMYPNCAIDPDSTTCDAESWSNVENLPQSEACNEDSDILDSIAVHSSTNWQDVDSDDPNKGQYRLINYSYDPTIGQAPGTGTLILEGRIKQDNSSAIATSRLEVKIPIEPFDENNPIPGVWLKTGELGNNNPVAGDVLLNDCDINLNNVEISGPYEAKYTHLEFPALPSIPASAPNLGTIENGGVVFPRGTDNPTTQKTATIDGEAVRIDIYEYVVEEIDLKPSSAQITINTGERSSGVITKVVFHLNGSIQKGGEILHSCDGIENCKPTDFQIFGHGDETQEICLNGNNKVEAFILAPDYSVGVAGAGSNGGIYGTVWANQWSNGGGCGSGTNNKVVYQTARWSDLSEELLPENLPPQVKSISEWTRQEAE